MAIDKTALYNIGYGLYVITTKADGKDNGMICNTVMQVGDKPLIAVGINKENYTHDLVKKSGIINVNCLTESAPFETFKDFGFQSGKDVDKFRYHVVSRLSNGAYRLHSNVNAVIGLKVENYIDCESHGLFICSITESEVCGSEPSMTYAFYHANVKPKPQKPQGNKKGYRCKICGYVYDGEVLPQDFICPICKHPASDFELIGSVSNSK